MQTFLPYADFNKSAKCLDRQRLGKQRVEAYQIVKALIDPRYGWQNHPAVKMWRGCGLLLIDYGLSICKEWINRGYRDCCTEKLYEAKDNTSVDTLGDHTPLWLGDVDFHRSHQSNLLRKNPEHYKQFRWRVSDSLPYVWPV